MTAFDVFTEVLIFILPIDLVLTNTSAASRDKKGGPKNIELEFRRVRSLRSKGLIANDLATVVNNEQRFEASHDPEQVDKIMNGGPKTLTTVTHDPRSRLLASQNDSRSGADAIMVTRRVEQVIHPRQIL